jgi:hypothetical protein
MFLTCALGEAAAPSTAPALMDEEFRPPRQNHPAFLLRLEGNLPLSSAKMVSVS